MLRFRRSRTFSRGAASPGLEIAPGLAGAFQTMGIIKACVGFLVIAAVVVGLFQVAPVMLANYSFQDDLKTVSLMDSSNLQKTDEDVRTMCSARSRNTIFPSRPSRSQYSVSIRRVFPQSTSLLTIRFTINLPGYSFDMSFNPTSGNKGF